LPFSQLVISTLRESGASLTVANCLREARLWPRRPSLENFCMVEDWGRVLWREE
jgi:hypothetical protein